MTKFFRILIIFSIIYPLIITLYSILSGTLPFGYDPARDLLSAQENLKKLTLIGPPGGIPGIFYGPYWIWLLSIGLIFSRDPRFIAIFVLVIPYFILFIGLLLKLSKIIGKRNCILLWLLFFFSYPEYINDLWHPHLAPIFLLAEIYLLVSANFDKVDRKNLIKVFFAGIMGGLVVNFHLAFGSALLLGSIAYFLVDFVISVLSSPSKRKLFILDRFLVPAIFFLGIFFVFLPSLFFEFRHGFHQMQAAIKTVANSVIYNTAVVGQTGLKKNEILGTFVSLPSHILRLPNSFFNLLFFASAVLIFYRVLKKSFRLEKDEKKLLILLMTLSISLLSVYLSSKNPIWSYHFIGVELIFLLFIGLIIRKISILSWLLTFWIGILFLVNINNTFIKSQGINHYSVSSLTTKKYIVEKVYQDARGEPFSVFAYSPAIYTYDYDYLFSWVGDEIYHQRPESDQSRAEFIYLIIPKTSKEVIADFINYRTPPKEFKTIDTWEIADGTIVVKREKI